MVFNTVICAGLPGSNSKRAFFVHGLYFSEMKFPERKLFATSSTLRNFGALAHAKFPTLDAALPIRGTYNEFYLFYGTQVAYWGYGDTQTHDGPWKITDKFKSLGKAGFDIIDAAMHVPGKDDEAFFFRGTSYVKIHLKDDRITSGPDSLVNKWPGLTQAGFDAVDAIMPVPDKSDEFYFFRANKLATIKVTTGAPDQIVDGPENLVSSEYGVTAWNGAFRFLHQRVNSW
ncbi:Hemopexin-like domain-containing protein [Penicillium pulvis]|uniref:Hemopexin-like domain-containing protein n=1 Tax=Penicillium pulvis TaxID=1562058 RepID=UPI002546BFA0|nr:Hemopexin-like domain-containing protein [Penicillium pulvis]KAJ5814281.1 Hemopexin-like domain-containing protein [Penicillium pulvis]